MLFCPSILFRPVESVSVEELFHWTPHQTGDPAHLYRTISYGCISTYLHIYLLTYLHWPRTGRTCTILVREPRHQAEDWDTPTQTLPPPTAELRTWLLVANWEPSHCICIYSLAATSVPAHPSLPWPRCYLLVSLEASCPVWRRLWWCDGCNCLHGQDNKVTGIIISCIAYLCLHHQRYRNQINIR